jgi:hypothetical protein
MKHAFLSTCLLFAAIASGHLCSTAYAQDGAAEKPAEKEAYLAKWESYLSADQNDQAQILSDMKKYTLAVTDERIAEILKGTAYAGRKNISAPRQDNEVFHLTWHVMAISSFENDRARDLLFEISTGLKNKNRPLANWAAYYLSLFPGSDELLPKIKVLLEEEIAREQKDFPDRAKIWLSENGFVKNPFQESIQIGTQWMQCNSRLHRLARLVRALEFNGTIPVEERERFNVFRREFAISYALRRVTPGGTIQTTQVSMTLPRNYEHFETYFQEYRLPGFSPIFIQKRKGD